MMDASPLISELEARIKDQISGYESIPKSQSKLQILISKVLFFNKEYQTRFTTTLYPKVYLADEISGRTDFGVFRILSHEYVHLNDAHRNLAWFSASYLFPQLLALISILSLLFFVDLKFLYFLFALFFAAPWPAYFRRKIEMRGYSMNMAIEYWTKGYISIETKKWIEEQFTGWNYYKMWTSSEDVIRDIKQAEMLIRTNAIIKGPEGVPFETVKSILKNHGLYRV